MLFHHQHTHDVTGSRQRRGTGEAAAIDGQHEAAITSRWRGSPGELDLVQHLSYSRDRPCRVLDEIAFVPVADVTTKYDFAAVGLNRNIRRIERSYAFKRLFDLFADFVSLNTRLDLISFVMPTTPFIRLTSHTAALLW